MVLSEVVAGTLHDGFRGQIVIRCIWRGLGFIQIYEINQPPSRWDWAFRSFRGRKFRLSFCLHGPLEVGLGLPKYEHQNGDFPGSRNGGFAETFATSQSDCPRFQSRKPFDVSD